MGAKPMELTDAIGDGLGFRINYVVPENPRKGFLGPGLPTGHKENAVHTLHIQLGFWNRSRCSDPSSEAVYIPCGVS